MNFSHCYRIIMESATVYCTFTYNIQPLNSECIFNPNTLRWDVLKQHSIYGLSVTAALMFTIWNVRVAR